MPTHTASEQDVDRFLATTAFERYQSVPLPHGRRTPGRNRRAAADRVLPESLAGKSVLDVGTLYGYFPFEAIRREAARAVGVEADPQRVAIATRVSALHGGAYEIRAGRAESLDLDEEFDVVLLLNVLHHVDDPVAAMRNLASLCRDTMVVAFPAPAEALLFSGARVGTPRRLPGVVAKATGKARRMLVASMIAYATRHVPLIGVGTEAYSTFYFTPDAFRAVFQAQMGLFSDLRFEKSPSGRRTLAFCKVPQ